MSKPEWQVVPILVLLVIGDWTKGTNDHGYNYHHGDSDAPQGTNGKHRRFGWMKLRPLWMDIEKLCFARTCVAPYAVQLISMEGNINHTAMFNMDIDDPAPPVDMYFPSPPVSNYRRNQADHGSLLPSDQASNRFHPADQSSNRFRSADQASDRSPPSDQGSNQFLPDDQSEAVTSITANFSVGLFGVDPTYRFPRHCHSMIENTAVFLVDTGMRDPFSPSPSIISFGADCLNLTFQITIIPSIPDTSIESGGGRSLAGAESADVNFRGLTSISDVAFSIGTPVPMWLLAVSAVLNAALVIALVALSCHVVLSSKKRHQKRLVRRQHSFAASSAANTTSTYVAGCNRHAPLPPPPHRPPPMANEHDQEPKYDVPWSQEKFIQPSNGTSNDHYKITFSTLPHKRREPQYTYYYSPNEDMRSPVMISGQINGSHPQRRTLTTSSVAI